jgi:hypothetical protein
MSLCAQEQQDLELIKDGLTGSGSSLVAMLSTFNRLASGEEMPAREKIRPGSRAAAGCARRGRGNPHRNCRYPRQAAQRRRQWTPPLLWLAITLSLIAVALVFSHIGSSSTCAPSLAMVCSHANTAGSVSPALGSGS